MTKSTIISTDNVAFELATEKHKQANHTVTSIQVALKDLGYDQKADWVKFNTYADVIQFIFEDKAKGYNMPPMSPAKFLDLMEIDTTELRGLYASLEDLRDAFDKPVAKDFVRVAKTKEEKQRLADLTEGAVQLNNLCKKGYMRMSDVRANTNGLFVIDRDSNEIIFNVHRF